MRLLLDACALLALADGTLPSAASAALSKADEAQVSVVSAWELAIKVSNGKLTLPQAPLVWMEFLLQRYDLRLVLLQLEIVCAAAALPKLHRDPFDRILAAMSQRNGLTILTNDGLIARYPGVTTLWSTP